MISNVNGESSDEIQRIAVAMEWEGMCKAHTPVAYTKFILARAGTVESMTKKGQRFDGTLVTAILSSRALKPPIRPIPRSTTQTTLKSSFPLKKKPAIAAPTPAPEPIPVEDEISEWTDSSEDEIIELSD